MSIRFPSEKRLQLKAKDMARFLAKEWKRLDGYDRLLTEPAIRRKKEIAKILSEAGVRFEKE